MVSRVKVISGHSLTLLLEKHFGLKGFRIRQNIGLCLYTYFSLNIFIEFLAKLHRYRPSQAVFRASVQRDPKSQTLQNRALTDPPYQLLN